MATTKLSKHQQIERMMALRKCKKFSGEYLPSHHGRGSWATTYSNEFISAATDLWLLYLKAGSTWPVADLSKDFRNRGFSSCRGANINFDRVEYLAKTHIGPELARRGIKRT